MTNSETELHWDGLDQITVRQATNHEAQPSDKGLAPGQVWAWLAGAEPPHWEVRGTGLIIEVETEVMGIDRLITGWREGGISTYGIAVAIQRIAARMNKACWCVEGVCCKVHDKHTTPHQHCVLR